MDKWCYFNNFEFLNKSIGLFIRFVSILKQGPIG